jgi:hypothetical protein
MMHNTLILLMAALILMSCDNNPTTSGDPDIEDYSFPMTVGKWWKYRACHYTKSDTNPVYQKTWTNLITLEVDRVDTSTFEYETYVLKEHDTANSEIPPSHRWYRNDSSGLYLEAYEKDSIGYPTINYIWLKRLSTAGEIQKYDKPFKCLSYPYAKNEGWIYNEGYRYYTDTVYYRNVREYLGIEEVITPIGVIKCYKIGMRYESEENTQSKRNSFLYVSKKYGLVKISDGITHIEETNAQGELTGHWFDIKVEKILVETNIK